MMQTRRATGAGAERLERPLLDRSPPRRTTCRMSSRLDELARATPATRDRYVDFLRAASSSRWSSATGSSRSTTSNAALLDDQRRGLTSGLWLATWMFQVMPVFFFVGGFSNFVAYDSYVRRGEPTSAFVRSRLERLLRPSLVFLGFWLVVQVVLHLTDIGGAAGPRLWGRPLLAGCIRRGDAPVRAAVVPGLLPHRGVRQPGDDLAPPPVPVVGAGRSWWWGIVVDIVGFGADSTVRYLNVMFVLLFPHQLGHFYADGTSSAGPAGVLGDGSGRARRTGAC